MKRVRLNKGAGGHHDGRGEHKHHLLKGRRRPDGTLRGGIKKGQQHKTTRILKEALIVAAESVGSDGYGKAGLVGYLMRIAIKDPKAFCALLARVIPLQITGDVNNPIHLITTDMTPQKAAELYSQTLKQVGQGIVLEAVQYSEVENEVLAASPEADDDATRH